MQMMEKFQETVKWITGKKTEYKMQKWLLNIFLSNIFSNQF